MSSATPLPFGSFVMPFRIIGTVVSNLSPKLRTSSIVEVAVGILLGGGKRTGLLTPSAKQATTSPKPCHRPFSGRRLRSVLPSVRDLHGIKGALTNSDPSSHPPLSGGGRRYI